MTDDKVAPAKDRFSRELIHILRPFMPLALLATVVGVLGGFSTAWLLATINTGLHVDGAWPDSLIATFVGLCIVTLVGNAVSGIANSTVGQRVIATIRKDISARIVCAPISAVEQYRAHRLLATLNSDVDTLSAFTFNFPIFAISFSVALGCIVYMIVLSPVLFAVAIAAIVIGVLINANASVQWARHYEGVRESQDQLQKQYRAIIEGAKELRVNRMRRKQVYQDHLSGAADAIADRKIGAMRWFYASSSMATTLFFAVVGIVLLLQHKLGIEPRVVSGFVIVLLYLRGPIEQIVDGLPALSQARVSFRRIAELAAQFRNREPQLLTNADPVKTIPFETISLSHAEYAMPVVPGATPFRLGPVDLTIQRGETLFIIGENGCGKTTLIKLLLGLYAPDQGTLEVDGKPLSVEILDDYRQLFSTVFSDYHLFDDLVARDPALIAQAQIYLEKLEIAHKVRVDGGAFSTIDLSAGQRKRLALVHALLEQRPIMLFDEWAADQDPAFRRVFYTEFLPELKRLGKTLIVISHDDRYFSVADNVIRLAQGKIVQRTTGSAFIEDGDTAWGAAPSKGDIKLAAHE